MADLNVAVQIIGKDLASAPVNAVTRSFQGLSAAAKAPTSALAAITKGLGQVGLASIGIQAVTQAAKGAAGALGVGLQNEMEQVRASFMAFTKDAGKTDDVLAQVRAEAAKTPFAFAEMARATASLMPVANQSRVALMDLVKEAEILAASNPLEGLEGASFSLREAMTGDFTSIIERFNLSRSSINKFKEEGVSNLEIVRRAMAEMGFDSDLIAAKAETLSGRWSTFTDTLDTLRMRMAEPIFNALKEGLITLQGLVDENMGSLEDLAGQIAGEFSRAISTAKSLFEAAKGAVAAFTTDAGAMGIVIERIRSIFGDTIADAIEPFIQRFRDAIPTIQAVAGDIRDRLGSALSWAADTAWPALQDAAGRAMGFFRSEVIPRLTEVKNWLQDQMGSALSWLTDTGWPGLQTAAAAVANFFKSEVVPRLIEVKNWLGDRLREAVQWMKDTGFPGLKAAGDDLVPTLKAIADTSAEVVKRFPESQPAKDLTEAWGHLSEAAAIMEEVLRKLIPAGGDSSKVMSSMAGAGDLFRESLTRLLTPVNQFALRVVEAARAIETLQSTWQRFAGSGGPMGGGNIGLQVGVGLAEGIAGQRQRVEQAGAELGNASIRGVQEALEIRSPSRKFMDIGEDMGAGLVLGWLSTGGELAKAVAENLGLVQKSAKDAAAELARDIATGLDTASNAMWDFERDLRGLQSSLQFDLMEVGHRMGRDINEAIINAASQIQDAKDQFARSMSDLAERTALDASIRGRREGLEGEIRPEIAGVRDRFDERRRQHAMERDLARARTDEERRQIRERFDEAEEERRFMVKLAEEEAAEIAKIEQRRHDLESDLASEALQRERDRMAETLRERMDTVNRSLDEQQAKIKAAAETETAKLKEETAKRVANIQTEAVDKIPGLTGRADTTITTFLDGIRTKIAAMAEEAIAQAGGVQKALADVITDAETAEDAVEDVVRESGGETDVIPIRGARQHGGPVSPGGIYRVGEAGSEWFVPDQHGTILPHGSAPVAATSGPDIVRALQAALSGMSVLLDGREVGKVLERRALSGGLRLATER